MRNMSDVSRSLWLSHRFKYDLVVHAKQAANVCKIVVADIAFVIPLSFHKHELFKEKHTIQLLEC